MKCALAEPVVCKASPNELMKLIKSLNETIVLDDYTQCKLYVLDSTGNIYRDGYERDIIFRRNIMNERDNILISTCEG